MPDEPTPTPSAKEELDGYLKYADNLLINANSARDKFVGPKALGNLENEINKAWEETNMPVPSDVVTGEKGSEEFIKFYTEQAQLFTKDSIYGARNVFSNQYDAIVASSRDELLKIAKQIGVNEELRPLAGESAQVFADYAQYNATNESLKKLKEKYDKAEKPKGKKGLEAILSSIPSEAREGLVDNARSTELKRLQAEYKAYEEAVKEKKVVKPHRLRNSTPGLRDAILQTMAADITPETLLRGYENEVVNKARQGLVKSLKLDIVKAEGEDDKAYATRLDEAVSGAMVDRTGKIMYNEIVKNGDKRAETALGLYFGASKDFKYSLGSRGYSEAFPEKKE